MSSKIVASTLDYERDRTLRVRDHVPVVNWSIFADSAVLISQKKLLSKHHQSRQRRNQYMHCVDVPKAALKDGKDPWFCNRC